MNSRFLYHNLIWDVNAFGVSPVIFSSSVGAWLTTRPLSFLFSPWRKKIARSSTAITDVDIIIDLGSVKSFNSAFLVNPKLHLGGSVELQVNATNSWGAPSLTLTFPTIDAARKLTGLYFATQNARWVRIRFRNLAAALDYAELGALMLGVYFEPTYTITDDFHRHRHDPSRVVTAYDGERQSHRLTKYDSIDAFLEAQPEADKETYLAMFDMVGTDTPFIFSVDAAFLNQTYYAYFPNEVTADYHRGTVDLWDIQIDIEEAR